MTAARGQRGFGAIAAIVVLVILAVLAAAIVSLATTQQITVAQDVQSARAWQAARAGNEWGLYQALQNHGSCAAARTLDLRNPTGFYVTVRCTVYPQALLPVYNEGESVPGTPNGVTVYRIEAIACPVNGCSPVAAATAAAPGYIERRRVVVATN